MESRSLLRLIRYHWVAVVICAQLGIIAGAALAVVAPREYTASADVFVQVTGGSSTSDIASTTNFSQQQARNFSAVATRERVLAPVIEKLGLDTTVAQLRDQISTAVPLNSTMITISATDISPDGAAAIANQVAKSLTEAVPGLTPEVFGESPVSMQVIESATPPSRPSSPNVPLYLFFGLLAGLVAATAMVVIRGLIGTKVHSAEQATEITGAAVVGSIVFDRHAAREPIPLFKESWSLRAEEYRQLRANLRFLQAGEAHKVFVVTSSVPGEGKSTTAANIAVAMAASGMRVALVEADLRRPTLGELLDLTATGGLSSVLSGESPLDAALQPWHGGELSVLLAGDTPPNPSELLESPRSREVFDEVRTRFDITIIDSPPLTAVADAAILARHLGGAVLVVGARRVKVRELHHAVDRLHAVGATIDGVVLNFATVSRSRRYQYTYSSKSTPAHDVAAPRPVPPDDATDPARSDDMLPDAIESSDEITDVEDAAPHADPPSGEGRSARGEELPRSPGEQQEWDEPREGSSGERLREAVEERELVPRAGKSKLAKRDV